MDLPVGFRFIPTALQLVRDYLSKKIMNQELPSNAVVECDVYDYEPWQLQGDHTTEYYFVRREKKFKKNEMSRMPVRRVNPKNRTSSFGGFWKASAGDKRIFDKKGNLIGRMKTLVFCLFANQKRTTKEYQKTNWIMHEYNLVDTTSKVNFQPWVLCSIRNNGVHQNTKTLRKVRQPQARARAEETVTEHALVEDNLINVSEETVPVDQEKLQQVMNYFENAFEDLPAAATGEEPIPLVDRTEQQMLSYYNDVFEDLPETATEDDPFQVDQVQEVQQMMDNVKQMMNNHSTAENVSEDVPAAAAQESMQVDQQQVHQIDDADHYVIDLCTPTTEEEPVVRQQMNNLHGADYVIDLRTPTTEEEPVERQQNNLHDADYQPQSSADNIEFDDLEELTDLQTTPSSLLQQSSFWNEIEYLQRSYPVDDLDYSFLDKGWDQAQPLFL